jgi:hypothetical protein
MARRRRHNTGGATWIDGQCGAGHCWHTDELDESGGPAEQEACYRRCCACGHIEYTPAERAHAARLDAARRAAG